MRHPALSLVLLTLLAAPAWSQRDPLWDAPIEARNVWLSTAVAKGKLVFVSGSERISEVENIERAILAALDAKTGELVWVAEGDPATGHVGGAAWQSTLDNLLLARTTIIAGGWREVVGPGWEGAVRAYDQKTGTLLWSKKYPGGAFTRVAVKGKTVYAATTLGYGSETPSILLAAYDLKTGSELWSKTHGPTPDDPQVHALACGGRYLAVVGRQKDASEPLNMHPLVRVHDAKTGAFLWQDVIDADAGAGYDLAVAAAIKGKRLFVGGSRTPVGGDRDDLLRAYHVKKGEPFWTHSPELEGDQFVEALVSSGSRVMTLSLGTFGIDGWLLRAHKPTNGEVRWDTPIDVGVTFISSSFAAKGRRVVVGVDHGTFAFDTKNGEPVWDAVGGGFDAAISGKRVFVPGFDKTRAYLVK